VNRPERTIVSASEEYLDASLRPILGIHSRFIVTSLYRALPSFSRINGILAVALAMSGSPSISPTVLGFPAGAEEWSEIDTALVERQRMTGVRNSIVRAGERHVFLDQSDGVHGVPAGGYEAGNPWTGRTMYHIPRNLISTSRQKVCLNCALNC